jgi:hypothetical protein
MNGTGPDLEGHLIQGVNPGKGFVQVFYLKYISVRHETAPLTGGRFKKKRGRRPLNPCRRVIDPPDHPLSAR